MGDLDTEIKQIQNELLTLMEERDKKIKLIAREYIPRIDELFEKLQSLKAKSRLPPQKWICEYNGQKFTGASQHDALKQMHEYCDSLTEKPPEDAKMAIYPEGGKPNDPIRGCY